MCHQQHRTAHRPGLLHQQRDDFLLGQRVQTRGRLIGKDQGGTHEQHARQRDALQLATGHLTRQAIQQGGSDPHTFQ